MSEREPEAAELVRRVAALTAERDRLAAEVEQTRAACAERQRVRDASVKARVRLLRRRRALTACALYFPVLLGVGAYFLLQRTEHETLRGHVAEIVGPAPVLPTEQCSLRIEPSTFPFNAWMQLDCGTRRLYGYESYGQIDCDTQDGRAARCEDGGPIVYDGDPHLVLDRPAGRLVVDDGDRWRIVIALEPTR